MLSTPVTTTNEIQEWYLKGAHRAVETAGRAIAVAVRVGGAVHALGVPDRVGEAKEARLARQTRGRTRRRRVGGGRARLRRHHSVRKAKSRGKTGA